MRGAIDERERNRNSRQRLDRDRMRTFDFQCAVAFIAGRTESPFDDSRRRLDSRRHARRGLHPDGTRPSSLCRTGPYDGGFRSAAGRRRTCRAGDRRIVVAGERLNQFGCNGAPSPTRCRNSRARPSTMSRWSVTRLMSESYCNLPSTLHRHLEAIVTIKIVEA